MKDKVCKTCGHSMSDKVDLDAIFSGSEDSSDIQLGDDDNMKINLLDELKDAMGSGIDGNIKVIIEKRKGKLNV